MCCKDYLTLLRILILSVIVILVLPCEISFAHQPRIVESNDVIQVSNPDISQAFYGWLEGSPQEFEFTIDDGDMIYISLLVPDVDGIVTDISAIITGPDTEIVLDGLEWEWTHFYEPFAGDHYLDGPEYQGNHKAGTYNVKVYSEDNFGKYVFVVGKKEEFPVSEMVNAAKLIPRLKSEFFVPEPQPAETAVKGRAVIPLMAIASVLFLMFMGLKLNQASLELD